jgi:MOSC domain-containing protein YiiM
VVVTSFEYMPDTTGQKRLLAVNAGQPREIETPRGKVLTSIFKSPVEGRVALRGYNLDGDRQSDLRVHGGPYKAVYLYASEHYAPWAEELGEADLPFGMFGENLTAQGMLEESVHIGDRFRVGSAVLQVSQPRMPCFKLALRFNRSDIIKKFWKSGRSGMYFSVVEEGDLGSGDAIQQIDADPAGVSVADVVRLYKGEATDPNLVERALRAPLFGSWKKEIQARWAEAELPF